MATCNLFQPVTGSNLLQILEKWLQNTVFLSDQLVVARLSPSGLQACVTEA